MSAELRRITYVEDEPDIRTIAEIALTKIGGYKLQVCESGTEAIARAPEFRPNLFLLDVMMPGVDGVETFKRLSRIPEMAKTPVIFMTAKVQRHETEHYRELGAIGVIPKPFDPINLPIQISEVWQSVSLGGETHAG